MFMIIKTDTNLYYHLTYDNQILENKDENYIHSFNIEVNTITKTLYNIIDVIMKK
jgi:hypothetical protein